MKLHSIAYTEFENEIYEWQLDEFELSNINLIVAKNATGKSRVLRIINGLAGLISGAILPNAISSGKYTAIFTDDSSASNREPDIKYSFSIFDKKITEEELIFDKNPKLKRSAGGRSKLFFELNNQLIDVQIPETHLAASARRDPIQHSYFEPLHKWATKIKYFEFAKIDEELLSAFEGKIPTSIADSISFQKNLHLITKLGKDKFGRTFESSVINDMRKIGYEITEFGLTQKIGVPFPLGLQVHSSTNSFQTLYVKEIDIEKKIYQNEISNGMIRALGTLIYLNFSRLNKKRDSLLIDDIGEGLDFERASKLVSILISEAEKGFIQLILTTNDRFIMNNVPLKYWSVLQREKGKVSVFNHHNSEAAFSDFEQYGFNNFDFFSKEYFSKGKKETAA